MRKGFTLIELMIVIAIIAIIAAIAIPNLLESRVTANEAAASASLKSGVFPAEVQFQGGGYQDADADNVGEYGTMGAMSGKEATTKIGADQIRLLQGPLQAGLAGATLRVSNGFNFHCFTGGLTTDATGASVNLQVEGTTVMAAQPAPAVGSSYNNAEKYFCVGAAPERFSDTGRRVFTLANDGQIRSPAAAADLAIWYGAAPVNGQTATLAQIQSGMADTFSTTSPATVPPVGQAFAPGLDMSMPVVYPILAK